MYMATIFGYTEVRAFSNSDAVAKKLALQQKKKLCKDDLSQWTWERVSEYYGTEVIEIKEGLVDTR